MREYEEDMVVSIVNFTPFTNQIAVMYPKELHTEKILRDNISKVTDNLTKYLEAKEHYDNECKILNSLHFDKQKEIQREAIKSQMTLVNKEWNELNKDLSPYYWDILTDANQYIYNYNIKADYLLVLRKGKQR